MLGTQLPFCLDVCQETFEQLDLLLKIVCHHMKSASYPPPRQEDECMAIATLNLLRLQFRAAISEEVDPSSLNLVSGSHLLTSLKQCIVQLACNEGVLESVQRAAQSVLQDGWVILMPTVTERAEALSSLLPSSEGTNHRVTSLLRTVLRFRAVLLCNTSFVTKKFVERCVHKLWIGTPWPLAKFKSTKFKTVNFRITK